MDRHGQGSFRSQMVIRTPDQRIAALRLHKSFSSSSIYGDWAYDESQMREADAEKRQQKSMLEYEC